MSFLIRLIRSSSYPVLIPFFDKEVNDFDVPEYVSWFQSSRNHICLIWVLVGGPPHWHVVLPRLHCFACDSASSSTPAFCWPPFLFAKIPTCPRKSGEWVGLSTCHSWRIPMACDVSRKIAKWILICLDWLILGFTMGLPHLFVYLPQGNPSTQCHNMSSYCLMPYALLRLPVVITIWSLLLLIVIWYDMVWYGMVWYDMIWYDTHTHIYICVIKNHG